ncbi:MAG: 3-isopropylmalate dehydrogenase [Gemmatimonadota bacterium]
MRIVLLPGDGVGPEVLDAVQLVLEAVASDASVQTLPIGYAAILSEGGALPDRTLEGCRAADAILLGAVGDPREEGLPPAQQPVAGLLRLRRELGCYANLRPVRVPEALLQFSPFRADAVRGTDLIIVRELTGGLYYGEPRGIEPDGSSAWNTMRYSVEEIERVVRLGAELADGRRGRLTSVDKSNVLEVSRLWRDVANRVADEFRDVHFENMLVDRTAMELGVRPTHFDVLVMGNLFGDILSDQAGALPGSLGLLGSASLGGVTDLYEPVHGSAPDIAGQGVANPAGMIHSLALMLRYSFAREDAAQAVEQALDQAFADGFRTADLVPRDGEAQRRPVPCAAFAQAVAERIEVD